MAEELVINVSGFESRVALLEEGITQEIHVARANNHSLTGNIYLGRVQRIMRGMQAAFVDIGLDRPGFLHAGDMHSTYLMLGEQAPPSRDISTLLRESQEIMVQITKDPISTKGARLTTQIAIASRHLVLMPFSDHIGISQRVDDECERDRLRALIEATRSNLNVNMGFIVRTAAEGVERAELEVDIRFLVRTWDRILQHRHRTGCPGRVYQELPLHIRMVRELAGPRLKAIHIDHEPTFQRVSEFVNDFLPEFRDSLQFHSESRPLFERFGIDDHLARALDRRVLLRNGGYLFIEQTEAMVTIDVNSGSYLGSNSVEETAFRTNLEAAQIIPSQLRLRNLGGIIVIDFIDMTDEEHRHQVLRVLEQATALDPAPTRLAGFSALGLVEMSRKRTRDSLQRLLCEPCGHCDGLGLVRTAQTTCNEIFRSILLDANARCERLPLRGGEYLILGSESVVDRLLDEDAEHLADLSRTIGRSVRIQVEPSCGPGQFDIVLMQDVSN